MINLGAAHFHSRDNILRSLRISFKEPNLKFSSPEVSQRGKENGNLDPTSKVSLKTVGKKVEPLVSNEGAPSTSGIASQTASGVLSGSGVLNAIPGSSTSSGLLSHMVSTMNADVAREYLAKVSDLLLEFAQADTTVKSYMCSHSLLNRLFQMFNRVEPSILLKVRENASLYSFIGLAILNQFVSPFY